MIEKTVLKSNIITEKNNNKSSFSLEDNIIDGLLDKFGIQAQIFQTMEEMCELLKELEKNVNRGADNKLDIMKECADVEFMLKQIKRYYKFNKDEYRKIQEDKMLKAATNL